MSDNSDLEAASCQVDLHESEAGFDDEAEHAAIQLDDWSQTGRGSHVEFQSDEIIPLVQGRFLGRGAVGDVHEVEVQGRKFAHKRMVVRRKLGGQERKEIEILKHLPPHPHIVQLVGTYTHREFLGIIMYPVAVCDLHTFFEDVGDWHETEGTSHRQDERLEMLEASQKTRLIALGYDFPSAQEPCKASLIYSKIGCLVSAVAYLHDRKIRHKDIKPSNILLTHDRLWLSDFGSATDFSLLSQSATDNERGSPRYFSPEVNAWQANGRAADIFSLGCVVLEMLVIHTQGTLRYMQANRSPNPAFHANLDKVDAWLEDPHSQGRPSRRAHLEQEIKSMLGYYPETRPTANRLLIELAMYELSKMSQFSVFGHCCKGKIMSKMRRSKSDSTPSKWLNTDVLLATQDFREHPLEVRSSSYQQGPPQISHNWHRSSQTTTNPHVSNPPQPDEILQGIARHQRNSHVALQTRNNSSTTDRVRLICRWGVGRLNAWLELDSHPRKFIANIEKEFTRRKMIFLPAATTLLLKPHEDTLDEDAFYMRLEEDDLEADWDETIEWVNSNIQGDQGIMFGVFEIEDERGLMSC
ncbi:hypothetical protein HBH68_010030 [Parastagonospora nodorum]|nr:hypothetical protein HBH82_007260 [Parastagonospora nodorum]KAH4685470.1 hypothetical protein HBH78_115050 [Parastagonospora nodorum]KAH4698036.1 hypothetical protein HBH67_178000 [Parastagonospora nodorum]KAH4794484.1 hypothetical protein HBH62_004780 [Parastagonospora nodorum]KAH4838007.1 hypothetical protein HBH63_002430 [Parastagonospora nodorum]